MTLRELKKIVTEKTDLVIYKVRKCKNGYVLNLAYKYDVRTISEEREEFYEARDYSELCNILLENYSLVA